MGIMVGVQFLFEKAPICKGFPIPFNENRLYSDSEPVAAEPVAFCLSVPFNERSVGCAFLSQGVCTVNVSLSPTFNSGGYVYEGTR